MIRTAKQGPRVRFLEEEDFTVEALSELLGTQGSFNTRSWLIGRKRNDYFGGYRFPEHSGTGVLPENWKVRYLLADPEYVVFSGPTPIAWHERGCWTLAALDTTPMLTEHVMMLEKALGGVDA